MFHYTNKCPKKTNRVGVAAARVPNPGKVMANQQRGQGENRCGGRGRAARMHARKHGKTPHVHAIIREPTLGDE